MAEERNGGKGVFALMGTVLSTSAWLFFTLEMILLVASLSFVPPLLAGDHGYLFLVTPYVVPILSLSGGILACYYILVVVCALLSFLLYGRMYLWPRPRQEKGRPSPRLQKEAGLVPGVVGVAVFTSTLWYGVVWLAGGKPSIPPIGDMPLYRQYFLLASAGFWEEIAVRGFYVVLPGALATAVYRYRLPGKKRSVLEVLRRGGDGPFLVDPRILRRIGLYTPLLLVSAIMFSLAHALGGWDLYKIPPTFITGLLFGYLAIERGLHVSILSHTLVNLISLPLLLGGRGSAAGMVVSAAGFIILLAMGMFTSTSWVLGRFVRRLEGKERSPGGDGR